MQQVVEGVSVTLDSRVDVQITTTALNEAIVTAELGGSAGLYVAQEVTSTSVSTSSSTTSIRRSQCLSMTVSGSVATADMEVFSEVVKSTLIASSIGW